MVIIGDGSLEIGAHVQRILCSCIQPMVIIGDGSLEIGAPVQRILCSCIQPMVLIGDGSLAYVAQMCCQYFFDKFGTYIDVIFIIQ